MKTLYLECGMGAAGDMLTAALLELLPDPDAAVQELNALGIPEVTFSKETMCKCGITGTHVKVRVHGTEESEEMLGPHGHTHGDDAAVHAHRAVHHHAHNHLHDIMKMVQENIHLPEQVKQDVMAVYTLIAEAESRVHGVPMTEIHFHEVGTMDAIADVAAVCLLMHRLAPEQVIVSPVHVGSGHVHCAHGVLPVPAPATAYILEGVPVYGGEVQGELCTPTGAALLKHFASHFEAMPLMRTEKIGYGMGSRDYAQANCMRAMLGETEEAGERVAELMCNVDDMTAEELGFAMETLLASGALEAYTMPAGMKKSRPGIILGILCREEDKERLLRLIFRHTTTIGVRESICRRYTLARRFERVQTRFGEVQKKISFGYGVSREKYEYEDLTRIAREQNMSLKEVRKNL